jgi:hypothetical protein
MSEVKMGDFFVNGIVSTRDEKPYIQLSNEKGMIAQLSMGQARQIANDIMLMCSRAEADAMIIKFFLKTKLPMGAVGELLQDFRDFRHELDMEKVEHSDQPEPPE